MNFLENYRWPDFAIYTFAVAAIIAFVVMVFAFFAFTVHQIRFRTLCWSILICLAFISIQFVPIVTVHEGQYFVKTEQGFESLPAGYYAERGMTTHKDVLFFKKTQKINKKGRDIYLTYHIPVNINPRDFHKLIIFEEDCREYCETDEDLLNVALFHSIEGVTVSENSR